MAVSSVMTGTGQNCTFTTAPIGGVAGIAYGVYKKLEGRYYGRKAPPKSDETKPKENE